MNHHTFKQLTSLYLASYIKGGFIEETQLQGLPRYTIEYVYVRVDNQLVLYNKTNTNY